MVENPNTCLEYKALKRFYDEGERQMAFVEADKEATRNAVAYDVEQTRRERRLHQKQDQEFMRTWNEVCCCSSRK